MTTCLRQTNQAVTSAHQSITSVTLLWALAKQSTNTTAAAALTNGLAVNNHSTVLTQPAEHSQSLSAVA
jgi:hypothetical protein